MPTVSAAHENYQIPADSVFQEWGNPEAESGGPVVLFEFGPEPESQPGLLDPGRLSVYAKRNICTE